MNNNATTRSGYDCNDLFPNFGASFSFEQNPREIIPAYGSIIYTVWDRDDNWLYVGIGGVGLGAQTPLEKRNPRSRIQQHRSGIRSGDQFCIYVHDKYIVPSLDLTNYQFNKGALDRLTRDYIRKYMRYRFMVFQTVDGNVIVRKIEKELKDGLPNYGKPLLNGL